MDHYTPHIDYRRERLQHEAEMRRLIEPQHGGRHAGTGRSRRTLRQTVAVLAGMVALTSLAAGAVVLGAPNPGSGADSRAEAQVTSLPVCVDPEVPRVFSRWCAR
jgi:hypothetical protein